VTRVFFDTNIFIYTLDQRSTDKRTKAIKLLHQAVADQTLVTSYQVIQEFFNVATSKFRKQLSAAEARQYAETILWPWCEVGPSPLLFHAALDIHEDTGWTYFDSLIVSGALQAGCETLFSEDLQDGRKFRGLAIRNPFA
jgi:predicted nucleic acid-binding protein